MAAANVALLSLLLILNLVSGQSEDSEFASPMISGIQMRGAADPLLPLSDVNAKHERAEFQWEEEADKGGEQSINKENILFENLAAEDVIITLPRDNEGTKQATDSRLLPPTDLTESDEQQLREILKEAKLLYNLKYTVEHLERAGVLRFNLLSRLYKMVADTQSLSCKFRRCWHGKCALRPLKDINPAGIEAIEEGMLREWYERIDRPDLYYGVKNDPDPELPWFSNENGKEYLESAVNKGSLSSDTPTIGDGVLAKYIFLPADIYFLKTMQSFHPLAAAADLTYCDCIEGFTGIDCELCIIPKNDIG